MLGVSDVSLSCLWRPEKLCFWTVFLDLERAKLLFDSVFSPKNASMRLLGRVLRSVAPVLVIVAGVLVFAALVATRPSPHKEAPKDLRLLVETVNVWSKAQRLRVQAAGTVVPAKEVRVVPQVSGRVVWRNPEFVAGGRLKQRAPLVRIDPSDYALDVEQRKASVEQAEHQLRIERSRQEIAKQEWGIIGEDARATAEGKSVALREPQVKTAEAALAAAKTAQQMAKLSASRTSLVAPFNAFVRGKTVDVGQVVGPGSELGTLVGSDSFWVQVSVPLSSLGAIAIPGLNAAVGEGAPVKVRQDVGGSSSLRKGRVLRLLGDLDPVGRMARLLVEIEKPLYLEANSEDFAASNDETEGSHGPSLPMLLGSYVQVEIEGNQLVDVIELPRVALRENNRALVYAGGLLQVRDVEVVWRREDSVLVTRGLKNGDEVIVSRVPNPVSGSRLRKAVAERKPSSKRTDGRGDGKPAGAITSASARKAVAK